MGIHRQRGAHVSPADEDTHTRAWAGRPRTGSPPNARPPYTIPLEVGSQYMNSGVRGTQTSGAWSSCCCPDDDGGRAQAGSAGTRVMGFLEEQRGSGAAGWALVRT